MSTSVPRRDRKAAAELLDRVEAVAESTDAEWCVGLLECSGAEIERLGSAVVGMTKVVAAMESVESGSAGGAGARERAGGAGDAGGGVGGTEAVQAAVLELLECLDRCGNAVLRSLAVLSAGAGEQSAAGYVVALEALRLLSDEHQKEVSSEEVSAAVAILPHMVEGVPLAVRVSANMALFNLCCRHGLVVAGADGV